MRTATRLLCILSLGCASAPPPDAKGPQQGKPEAAVAPPDTVRIVEPAVGKASSKRAEPLLVPFGVNQNGTVLILALVERAAQQGAAYVGDLQLVWTFRWGGTAIECRSKVLFDGDPSLAPHAAAVAQSQEPADPYGTQVEKFRPRRIAFTATEKDLFCAEGTQQIVTTVRASNSTNTFAENGRRMDRAPGSRTKVERVIGTERRDRCQIKDVTRPAERYDYEIKLGFVPPNWEYISSRYADRKLVQGAPSCYRIEDAELAKGAIYRLTAMAYYKGEVAQRLPEEPPSVDMVEQLTRPEGARAPGVLHARCKAMGRKDCDMNDPADHGDYREH